MLLLGIRVATADSHETDAVAANVAPAVPPPLDPVGPTGFAAVPVASATIDGRFGMTGEGLLQDRPSLAADDGSSSLRDSLGGNGGTSPSTGDSTDAASSGPREGVPDDVSLPSADSVIPVNPDPGINLDPATSADQNSLAAILHVVLNAILPMVGQGEIPGDLGDAISSAVRECEPEMAAGWKADATQDAAPAEKVFKIVTTKLGVSVASTDSQSALNAWRDHAQSRAHYALLDENKNGLVADDVAVWFIVWLQKKGLFNPASSVKLVRNDIGKTVAVVSPNKVQPEWVAGLTTVNGLLHLALRGNSGASSTAGGNGNASGETNNNISANTTTVTIPKGTSPVTITSSPSRIRVPDALNGQLARDVVPKLRAVGLQLKADGALISTDKVTQTDPAQGAWVSPSDRIALKILRRVPRVTGQHAKDAETKLKDFELSPRTHEDAVIRPEDLVSAQQPSEGDYVERGTAVLLTFHRKVPKVEGLTARVAQTQLTEAGFRALGPVDGDIFANDVVLKQDPAWEQNGNPVFCEPGAAVRFVRLGARVPDLCGANLAAAKTLLDARNLLDKCQLRYELAKPITECALARVLDQTPAAGDIIDRGQGKVVFHVVVPVPELDRLAPLNDVQNKLRERDLVPELTAENAMPDDVVVSAVASGRVFTADSVRYVVPGSEVQLTVGRVVPSLKGEPWRVALGELQRMGLRHHVPSGESPGTHVHHTSPEGGKVIATTEAVLLHPGVQIPDVVGTSLDEAKARIERLGLGVRTTTTLQEVEDPGLQGKTKVARQSPQPDDIVLRSSATIVLLSAVQYGEGSVAVPQFQGLAYTDAKELADELGLRIVVRTSATRITQDRDQHGRKLIDGQFTAAGTRVRKGTDIGVSVNQLVFQQPRPEYVVVPDLVNDRARETQFTVEQAIAIAKQAKFTPIISYRGQQFNEAGWAVLAASYLIPPNTPPQVRRDLQAFRALSIYQLRAGNQSPAPKTQAQPGDRIVIEVRVAASR